MTFGRNYQTLPYGLKFGMLLGIPNLESFYADIGPSTFAISHNEESDAILKRAPKQQFYQNDSSNLFHTQLMNTFNKLKSWREQKSVKNTWILCE